MRRSVFIVAGLVTSLGLLLAACAPAAAGIVGTEVTVAQQTFGPSDGYASWYGPGFYGRRTASGEVYDGTELTAAHKSLPFGTVVRVTNLDNGSSVLVRINDRGPFKPGRIIDLSPAAAREIGLVGQGVVPVRLELVVGDGSSAAAPYPQLGRFDVISPLFRPGQLLLLRSPRSDDPVVVRVVANTMPADVNADMLLSPELYAALGPSVLIVSD